MAKLRRVFVCRSCGSAQHRWAGKCPDCGAWDSLEEQTVDPSSPRTPRKAWSPRGANSLNPARPTTTVARPISEINADSTPTARIPSGIAEFDRVLGGSAGSLGLVPGSAVLIGGEPGIGKSTLLLQAATAWAVRGTKVLYVSSEESAQQVAMRAARLSQSQIENPKSKIPLFLLADTNLARIVEQTRKQPQPSSSSTPSR